LSLRSVAIVGGGPVGLALALALSRQGVDCVVLEARAQGATGDDRRAIALSQASCAALQRLGVADDIGATPITEVHISQQGHLGRTLIRAAELGLDRLGGTVTASALADALAQACRKRGVRIVCGARVERIDPRGDRVVLGCSDGREHDAQLVAWAEGQIGDADGVRARDYGQRAVVAQVDTTGGHTGIAFERFADGAAIALLPLGRGHAVVCSACNADADAWQADDDDAFLARLGRAFGGRLHFSGARPRAAFPLALRLRRCTVGERAVWLGNAAQTLHPIAGQGFNLALRDVTELARRLGAQPGDCGAPRVLAAYAAARQLDRRGTVGLTDLLARSLVSGAPLLAQARGTALLALDLLPAARRFAARRLIFRAGNWP